MKIRFLRQSKSQILEIPDISKEFQLTSRPEDARVKNPVVVKITVNATGRDLSVLSNANAMIATMKSPASMKNLIWIRECKFKQQLEHSILALDSF